ncbi:MAG: response regulator [Sphingomonas sp.]|uniref:response regulator n=1 Tax=Sphingomonas sp. TaxID=28214 RepID=UPI001AC0185A|nr:response regulator [Sphingomonas sp.]MBN8807437.1 response regulator [Sphingomonas sp.]
MTVQRILIVEDEPLIAMMLEDFVDALGKTCVGTCDTVQSALATIADETPDAVILDVNLSGGEKSWPVADALAEKGIPFVLSSGGDEVVDGHADRPRLSKPFTMDGMEKALAALG